jgi:hypothetical protein
MKLEAKTIEVLSNFCSISPSILIKEGDVLTTVSPGKTILAKAKVPNTFPKKFAIYQLSQFLGAVSAVKDNNLSFGDKSVIINNTEGSEAEIFYCPEENVKTPPEKGINLPSVDVFFKLIDKSLKEVIRGSGMFQVSEIAFVGDGENIYIQALDVKNPTSNIYRVKLGTTDKTFRIVFKVENLIKLMSTDYEVSVSSKGISHFKSDAVEYWVAVETTSTYTG